MARSTQEIFDGLIALKDANPILAPICTSASKAAFYRNLFDLFAEFGSNFETSFDDFVLEIDALMVDKQVMNDRWWQAVSLAFQLGDALSINDSGNLYYDPINTDNQIVKRAAVVRTDSGAIDLKIAKLDTDDITPIALSLSEKTAFDSYINDITPSGIAATVISVAGDEIQVALDVVIDSQLINVDDGTLLSDGTTKPVNAAIYDYFATFQGDDFGGVFYANNMLANILSATGVINATYVTLTKKAANEGAFSDVLALSGKSFRAYSGYVKLETGYDLSANITYSAE